MNKELAIFNVMYSIGNEMNEIMGNFEAKGHPGFPRIIGVIDGTHIRIRAPVRQPDAYLNRKKIPFSCCPGEDHWRFTIYKKFPEIPGGM